jgi:hypothetical protein
VQEEETTPELAMACRAEAERLLSEHAADIRAVERESLASTVPR